MTQPDQRLTIEHALSQVPETQEERFKTLFQHGSLEVEVYAPRGEDPQQPHDRDEIYVIISGSGLFLVDGQRQPFKPGEVLFVPAGVVHRFEDFTDDFATWVFFYGPEGGEAA